MGEKYMFRLSNNCRRTKLKDFRPVQSLCLTKKKLQNTYGNISVTNHDFLKLGMYSKTCLLRSPKGLEKVVLIDDHYVLTKFYKQKF